MHNVCALVLAAGKGTRMPSKKPKVLQTLLGDTMIACVHHALKPILSDIYTLVGYKKECVLEELAKISQVAQEKSIEQKELLGTAHALQTALPHFQENHEYVLVTNGDVPLLSTKLIQKLIDSALSEKSDILFATIELEDIANYGRIVRDKNNDLTAIVEAKDYDESVYGKPSNEINSGLYIFNLAFVREFLPKIENNNANNEYYITDLVELALQHGKKVIAHNAGNETSLLGVNNPYELSQAEEILRERRNRELLEDKVILHNPSTISISQDVEIAEGVEIFPHCELYGKTTIAKDCIIDSHCRIENCIIGENTHIASFSHLENAEIGAHCKIGPYARLRPMAKLEDEVHVGNFVEIKKSILQNGVKANHLSYIGDAEIGSKTNIGAGTITCNYDGKNKHLTKIGNNCFIGSNTALVAPVELKENVLVGAGSVITKNVEKNALVVARAKQVHLKK